MAMGRPLRPALAYFFVDFYEGKLFGSTSKSPVYFRYVEDTTLSFSFFQSNHFLLKLNALHPSLEYTLGKEQNSSLQCLDIVVENTATGFLTSIYRKPTFSGLHIRCDSFNPKQRKINLIKTLVHRALMVCSKAQLDSELDKILIENVYPEDVFSNWLTKSTVRLLCLFLLLFAKFKFYATQRLFIPQLGMMIAENWMNNIALHLGKDPEVVREMNLLKKGQLDHCNQMTDSTSIVDCWNECMKLSRFHETKGELKKFNAENKWKKRGISIIPTSFGISFAVQSLDQAG